MARALSFPGRSLMTMSPNENSHPRVLVADDQRDVLEALRLLLKGEDFVVETAASPAAILAALDKRDFDLVLMDLNYTRDTTSGREGLDLLPRLRQIDSTLPVIVMTAWSTIDGAVEAMREGARDYIEKPWQNARLIATLRTQFELGQALRRSQRLELENSMLRRDGMPTLIAESRTMQPVLELMDRVSPSDANVLITGEHGTGKEVVARWIHAASERASSTLVTVDVGAISDGVFESELFGHVKGSFTDARSDRVGYFELAGSGTLFLDEIANIPTKQQAKFLRVLETGELQRVGSSRTQHASVHRARSMSMCASCRLPTSTCRQLSPAASFVRICCIASTQSRSSCPRSATGGPTSRCSAPIFSRRTHRSTAASSRASTAPPCRQCSPIAGRATSVNCSTLSNARY